MNSQLSTINPQPSTLNPQPSTLNPQPPTLNSQLTIITYHYVRPLANSRYPNLKVLDYDLFKKQIEWITKKYRVVNMEDVIGQDNGTVLDLSTKPLALLAFDDGYIDHYTYVFPILQQYGIQGSFFIPVKPILEQTALDVNKIHYLLETTSTKALKACIGASLNSYRAKGKITETNEELFEKYTEENRFDDKDTMFVKRLLQKWDNTELKKHLINELWDLFILNPVSMKKLPITEAQLSQELYMNPDQIRHMHRAGMYIGGHTHNHYHLGSQTSADQDFEIRSSYRFLVNDIGCNPKYLTLSYPYGSHNQTTKDILKEHGFKLGIGINYGPVNLNDFDHFNVPRIDCNDITKMMQNESK